MSSRKWQSQELKETMRKNKNIMIANDIVEVLQIQADKDRKERENQERIYQERINQMRINEERIKQERIKQEKRDKMNKLVKKPMTKEEFDRQYIITFNKYYSNVISSIDQKNDLVKHFIPLNKQWKNGIYSYNKNNLSLSTTKQQLVDKITRSYFNLIPSAKDVTKSKRMRDFLRRSSIKNVYISNSEIKETNDKLYVTLYIFDRNKQHFIKKLHFSNNNLKNVVYGNKLGRVNMLRKIAIVKHKGAKKKLNRLVNYKTKNLSINITRKNIVYKTHHKLLLKKRRRLIRKRYIKQSKFNQLKFFSIKKNILKIFNKNFSFKFWIWLSKCLSISFSLYKNKFIFKWPENYNTIDSSYYKSVKLDQLNVFNLNRYIKSPLIQYKVFNIFNLVPSNKLNKMTVYIDNNNFLNKNYYKLMIFYITKKLVISNLLNLYGRTTTQVITNVLWKRKFAEYYNEFIGKRVQKYISNLNKLLYDKDLLSHRRNKHMSILKSILENFYNKKALLNVVNMKYIYLNSDNYMDAIRKKLKKRTSRLLRVLRKSLKLVKLPRKLDFSNDNSMAKPDSINKSNNKSIHSTSSPKKIINKISYKYVTGVRLEAKGRLTRRYTASRALFKFRYKGNLKNLEYSKTHRNESKRSPHLQLIRGSIKPNIQRTFISGTRRIGVFGMKGWLSGN